VTIDAYSNCLNSDQMPSNSASDLDPSCLTTTQKVPPNLKKTGRYLKTKQTIYLAYNNFCSRLRVNAVAKQFKDEILRLSIISALGVK